MYDALPTGTIMPSDPIGLRQLERLHLLAAENAKLQAENRAQQDELLALRQENLTLQRANSQLREIDAAKDQVWRRLGHELRTPLNFVTGFASILGDEIPGQLNSRQQEYVRKILGGADRILRLVDTFVNLAELEAGTLALDRRPTSVGRLVEDVVQAFKPLADHKMIRLVSKVNVGIEPLIDGPRVALVLSNLLANAIQHNPDGGFVTVRARVQDGELLAEVEDSGSGLHPLDIERILSRDDLTPSPNEGGGLGLGVTLGRRLVNAHGGRLGLKSELGCGSTFWFTLPIESQDDLGLCA
jgi:signal transduction histidine kinase